MNTNSNKIDERRFTPKMVVEDNLGFSIPLYQRLFAWGDEQIEGFMQDLIDHFLNPNEKIAKSPYYIGQMTVVYLNNKYALIDGQQRFTAMTLLAIALKDFDEWKDFVHNGSRVEFVGRSQDKEFINNTLNGKSDEYVNVRMKSAIEIMKRMMPSENIELFATRIYEHLSFFFAQLGDNYIKNPASLNKYFEAMNSTGKGLEQHEILKVELMRNEENQETLTRIWNVVSRMDHLLIHNDDDNCVRECINLCRDEKYEEAIIKLNNTEYQENKFDSIDVIEPSSKEPDEERNNYTERTIISFPQFLLLVLNLTSNDEDIKYRPENLLSIFKEHRPKDIMKFYGELLHYRLLLDLYCVHIEYNNGVGRHRLVIKDEEMVDCLKQYLAMLNVSTSYNRWLGDYLKFVHNSNEDLSPAVLLKEIKSIDNNIDGHGIPEDVSVMSYSYMQGNHYLFSRLDYYLYEKRKECFKDADINADMTAINNYEFRKNRSSIEHLHPQNESNNQQWKEYDLNSFGNLAMISQSFNSEQSNDPVEVKFARIKEQAKYSELQSLKLYKMYLSAGTNPNSWSEDKAKEHEAEMFELLKKSYTESE